ncbi:MAG TPA: phosphotransferase family protein [Amnibacterium sp.]|nr:phosphotransferase family protein [Amnibacterium sp.]
MSAPFDFMPGHRAAVTRLLAARGIDLGPFDAEPVGDGHSNLTYLLRGASRTVVLRRPPPPPLPPGANDVLREARIIAALHGSAVPVPEVLATAEAGEVFDVPCFVMTFVPGLVVAGRTPAALATADERSRIADGLVDAMVALHGVDWRSAGLRGRPDGANLRQLARLGRLVASADGAPPPGFAELDAWLSAHAPPESGAVLLHNDLRLGNVLIAPDPPARVTAVLDWELAAVGDPLADLGYLIASWPERGRPVTPVQAFGLAALEPGFPDATGLATRYAARSGRELADLRWHVVNAHRKLAVLYEYNRRRAERGEGDPYYADPRSVAAFLEAAEAASRA